MLSVAASVSKEGTQAARTLLSHPHPTAPHPIPPASGDDAMLSVAASVSEEGTQLPGRYYPTPPHPPAPPRTLLSHPTPPHPPAPGDDAMLTVATSVTRMLVSESRGWWLRNRLFLVAKSSFFGCGIGFFLVAESSFYGCGIVFFWLRKAPFLGCGSVSDFGCGIAEIWLRKRGSVEIWFRNRNLFMLYVWLNFLDFKIHCIVYHKSLSR